MRARIVLLIAVGLSLGGCGGSAILRMPEHDPARQPLRPFREVGLTGAFAAVVPRGELNDVADAGLAGGGSLELPVRSWLMLGVEYTHNEFLPPDVWTYYEIYEHLDISRTTDQLSIAGTWLLPVLFQDNRTPFTGGVYLRGRAGTARMRIDYPMVPGSERVTESVSGGAYGLGAGLYGLSPISRGVLGHFFATIGTMINWMSLDEQNGLGFDRSLPSARWMEYRIALGLFFDLKRNQ